VVFWLADPLRELYPECFAEAMTIATSARARAIRVVNPPEALSNTIKSRQADLWQRAGLPCAPVACFGNPAEIATLLDRARYPVIVRPDLLHGQQSVHFCSTRAAAETAAASMTAGAVIPFVDTRSGYARTRPGTIWHRLYHKKRAFVLGDEVVPNHVYFSSHPICGLKSSTFARYRRRWRWSWLAYVRPLERAALRVDDSFWRGPAEHPALLRRAVQTLGLDFAAVDYSVGADGEPVLWEANPYFDLPDPARGAMPRERHLHHRIGGFDRAIGRFLAGLLAAGRVVPE
jgi:hypothetical protein